MREPLRDVVPLIAYLDWWRLMWALHASRGPLRRDLYLNG